ncbi:MAG: DUF4276 family protein [Zavarzinella sp.]|nr:DUF4276 family protein [Zavarzinella sp.]
MKRVYIFVEGPTDAEFLRRILPPEVLTDAEIITAGGSSGVASLARSVLVRRKTPIAVVMDADSTDPSVVQEQQESVEDLIQAADASIPVKVVTAVPEIDAWLLAAPEAIERALGEPVPDEFAPLAKRDPRGVLTQLAERNEKKWDLKRAISLLETHDIDRIRALPEVNELSTFLKKVQEGHGARSNGHVKSLT